LRLQGPWPLTPPLLRFLRRLTVTRPWSLKSLPWVHLDPFSWQMLPDFLSFSCSIACSTTVPYPLFHKTIAPPLLFLFVTVALSLGLSTTTSAPIHWTIFSAPRISDRVSVSGLTASQGRLRVLFPCLLSLLQVDGPWLPILICLLVLEFPPLPAGLTPPLHFFSSSGLLPCTLPSLEFGGSQCPEFFTSGIVILPPP